MPTLDLLSTCYVSGAHQAPDIGSPLNPSNNPTLTPTLQSRTRRHKEVKTVAHGHPAVTITVENQASAVSSVQHLDPTAPGTQCCSLSTSLIPILTTSADTEQRRLRSPARESVLPVNGSGFADGL